MKKTRTYINNLSDKVFSSDFFKDTNLKKSGKRLVGIVGCLSMIPIVYMDSFEIFNANEAIVIGLTTIFAGLLGSTIAEKPKI